tara:strand:- start:2224 stop:2739 length:516 start_codon:yes stop_codon:yes gene_type:complete
MQNGQNESVLDFEISDFEAVPPGQYIALFKDVTKTKHEQWGEGVMFCFEVATGPYKGQIATRIGKPNATKQNATGKLIMGMTASQTLGRVNLRPLIGSPFNIFVESTQGGKTRISQAWPFDVRSSMPIAQQEPQSAPVAPPVQSAPVASPSQSLDDLGKTDLYKGTTNQWS